MRVLTWNINGIRSFNKSKWLSLLMNELKADVICLQETKVNRETLESDYAIVDGFTSYFVFCKIRSGYSGVATYCRNSHMPTYARAGFGDDENDIEMNFNDDEGRCVITQFDIEQDGRLVPLTLINVYCPRADDDNNDRLEFKMRFYNVLEARALTYRRLGHYVIIVGDINTSHRPIDNCDPLNFNKRSRGRIWMDNFIASCLKDDGHFFDVFRYIHPDRKEAYTCWDTRLNCRSTNFGTRIDYILASREVIMTSVSMSCDILSHIMGSDHCPVKAHFKDLHISVGSQAPPLATKYFAEFKGGKQTTLDSFVNKRNSAEQLAKYVVETKKCSTKQTNIQNFFSKSISQKNDGQKVLNHFDLKADVAPLCSGHGVASVLRTVKKKGPHAGKQFWCCSKGTGLTPNKPNTSCNFFKWY